MAYASWSVVFGEQPSAAKWNILGTNDASFNDGTGIANLGWATTALSNPYKFSAYKTTSQATVGDSTKITFGTEDFDTNNNFASSTYTAPVAGFYLFNAQIYIGSAGTYQGLTLYKNGSQFRRGSADSAVTAGDCIEAGSWLVNAAANDTFDIYFLIGGGATRTIFGSTDVTGRPTTFEGILLSRT